MNCKICSNSFYAKPNWIRRGDGKYCSVACKRKAQKTGTVVQCFICKKEVYRARRHLLHSKSRKYFCGKSCQTIWRNTMVFVGPNHANWKNGENTYRRIMLRNNLPQICAKCRSQDKRTLTVHHIDKIRTNNSLRNLAWLCHNCHFLVHHYIEERGKFLEAMV